jgi:hypothetical protein
MQHACYVCASGLALNKNAQAWFAPRQILPLSHIMTAWQEPQLHITLYVATA